VSDALNKLADAVAAKWVDGENGRTFAERIRRRQWEWLLCGLSAHQWTEPAAQAAAATLVELALFARDHPSEMELVDSLFDLGDRWVTVLASGHARTALHILATLPIDLTQKRVDWLTARGLTQRASWVWDALLDREYIPSLAQVARMLVHVEFDSARRTSLKPYLPQWDAIRARDTLRDQRHERSQSETRKPCPGGL
jgi:hypothetical protein